MTTRTGLSHLLAAPLGGRLLGVEVGGDVYATNGFRFVATSADVDRDGLEAESKRLRNLHRLSPERATEGLIRLGYESYLQLDELPVHLARLESPRDRIICELFWPHLPERLSSALRKDRQVLSPRLETLLTAAANKGNPEKRILATHALAIGLHNRAITSELASAMEGAADDDAAWAVALSTWATVLESDVFWHYLRLRAASYDDPRCVPGDVDRLRSDLPSLLPGFNALFGSLYAKSLDSHGIARHAALIRNCPLPETVRDDVLRGMSRTIGGEYLEPLERRVREFQKRKICSYKGAKELITPILDEIETVCDLLREECHLPGRLIDSSADQLCARILKAVNTRIDYQGPDRDRAILYSSLVAKRLLRLPLSPSQRRRLKQSIRTDRELLYKDLMGAKEKENGGLDHTACWFMKGEEADPDSSFVMPHHKIVGRDGTSIRYQAKSILVPRSRLAKQIHEGSIDLLELARIPAAEVGSLEERARLLSERLGRALSKFDSKAKAREQTLRRRIDVREKKLADHLAKVKKSGERARRTVEVEISPRVRAAKRKLAAVRQSMSGHRVFLLIQLPLSAACLAVLTAGSVLLGRSSAPTLWSIAGSLLLGWFAAQRVRRGRIAAAESVLDSVTRLKQGKIRRTAEKHKEQLRGARSAADRALKGTRAELAKIEQERARILRRFQPRAKKAEADFPPLSEASRLGFKYGKKPRGTGLTTPSGAKPADPKRRLQQLLESMSPTERSLLLRMSLQMPPAKFVPLVDMLMAAPPQLRGMLMIASLTESRGKGPFGKGGR